MTRLHKIIELLGWQGGTCHQVNEEINKTFSIGGVKLNFLDMSEDTFEKLLLKLEEVKNEKANQNQ